MQIGRNGAFQIGHFGHQAAMARRCLGMRGAQLSMMGARLRIMATGTHLPVMRAQFHAMQIKAGVMPAQGCRHRLQTARGRHMLGIPPGMIIDPAPAFGGKFGIGQRYALGKRTGAIQQQQGTKSGNKIHGWAHGNIPDRWKYYTSVILFGPFNKGAN